MLKQDLTPPSEEHEDDVQSRPAKSTLCLDKAFGKPESRQLQYQKLDKRIAPQGSGIFSNSFSRL